MRKDLLMITREELEILEAMVRRVIREEVENVVLVLGNDDQSYAYQDICGERCFCDEDFDTSKGHQLGCPQWKKQ